MTQKDLNRMMGQPHAALDTQEGYVERQTTTSTTTRAYAYNNTGDTSVPISADNANGNTLVMRTNAGRIVCADPITALQATTKGYVDESIKNAVPSTTPLLVMYNYYSKDIVDFVIKNVGASGGLTSPFIMFDVGDGTESSQPPLAVSNIFFVNAEYIPGGDVDGHIINIHVPEGVYYCTDTSGSFEYTM